MIRKLLKTNIFRYLVEALTLALVLGISIGVILGFYEAWVYASNGFFLPVLNLLEHNINKSIPIVFIFTSVYLIAFLNLHSVLGNVRRACLLSSAIALTAVFIFLFYYADQIIFTGGLSKLIQSLLIWGAVFIALWFLVSILFFFWTKRRVLEAPVVNIRGLSLLIGIVLLLNLSTLLTHRLYPNDSPNVMILLIDCLRADHLSLYGYNRKTTPNIDELSKDAVVFTQAISQSTWTQTSMASLFTSLYPYQHGVDKIEEANGSIVSGVLNEQETTLAEVLFQNGFLTMAWTKGNHMKSATGFAQGFVKYDDNLGLIEEVNKEFTEWLSLAGSNSNFFAYLHYNDLHDPYRPKPPYDTMYGIYSDVYSGIDFSNTSGFRKKILQGITKKDVDQLMAYYDGLLTYIDHRIGVLLDELKMAGLYDDTIIIVTADHGDGFMEHGYLGHSKAPYEELIRVPLIIKFPNSQYGGEVVKSQVRLIDVMPTILDYLGIRVGHSLAGFSLLSFLSADGKKDGEIDFPGYAYSERGDTLAIRTEKFKYIYFQSEKGEEFYDLVTDPHERDNIIASKQEEAAEFRKIALGVISERATKKKDVGEVVLDKEAIEELKALGYIE
ncbi:MAG TPA: sulfatase [Thermodesulfobacteriota bacterium]|nr:sulfatase [Thermodesulfobacteriota bacterium]